MINIASYSGGKLSAIMVEKLLVRGGDIEIIFMDTGIEDDDNYRFMQQCRDRWQALYPAAKYTVLAEGRTPYQVFSDQHLIPTGRAIPCTERLKIEPFARYMKGFAPADITIHIGYDFSEIHRCEPTRANYARRGWAVDFPMLWKPIELRNYDEIIREWGIEPPRMYGIGYSHANCGGMCVKQGAGDWIKTLINFPERFAQAENWEREMRKNEINAKYTILTRVRNGVEENLSLETLRVEYQANNQTNLFAQFQCVQCGIGDYSE